jgi:hypothetical protein
MGLIVALLVCAYVIGSAWAARVLFRTMLHERHMALEHDLGDPPRWWEYPLCGSLAMLWPLPMLFYLAVDFFYLDDV